MFNHKQLESFVRVAELGSFSKAALVLGLSLVLPERPHQATVGLRPAVFALGAARRVRACRKLLDTQAARAGLKLQVAWEVSSVSFIIDPVCAGHGHAVLTRSAAAALGSAAELRMRPLAHPRMPSMLSLVYPATKKATPLQRQVGALLKELTAALA